MDRQLLTDRPFERALAPACDENGVRLLPTPPTPSRRKLRRCLKSIGVAISPEARAALERLMDQAARP
jgi:hypothetical protein